MKYIVIFTVAAAALLTAFACAAPNAAPDDAQALQGMWKPIRAELAGQPMDDATLKTISLRLYDGKYEVYADGTPDRGTYSIDPAAAPKGMTITGNDGPNNGKTFPAIYELKSDAAGNTLRICYDLSGAKRPTEFRTVAGTKLYLVTYSRQN